MKIQRIQESSDGQKIYVLGSITPLSFRQYMDQYSDSTVWSREHQAHHAIKRLIKLEYGELYQWLCSQDCQTTNWIDDKIFSLPYQFSAQIDLFDWGIGFRSNDPKETLFILKWQ
jgi:hypothetical protein